MKPVVKRVLKGVGIALGVLVAGVGIFAAVEVSSYESSMSKVYDIPLPTITASKDPAVIARGKHLTESIAPCATAQCHGPDLGGGTPVIIGPLAVLTAPNITPGGLGAAYSDAELARLIRHGVKKDGRSLRFMPAQEFNWLPESDVQAIVSYLRSVPGVDRPNGVMEIKTLAKILDRRQAVTIDVAGRIDHSHIEIGGAATPDAKYGTFLVRLCTTCHGDHLSGGRIPGAPSSLPVPLNITPHETGLAAWSFEDFEHLLDTGVRKNGKKLDPFMPRETYANMTPVERQALWAALKALPPVEFGHR